MCAFSQSVPAGAAPCRKPQLYRPCGRATRALQTTKVKDALHAYHYLPAKVMASVIASRVHRMVYVAVASSKSARSRLCTSWSGYRR